MFEKFTAKGVPENPIFISEIELNDSNMRFL